MAFVILQHRTISISRVNDIFQSALVKRNKRNSARGEDLYQKMLSFRIDITEPRALCEQGLSFVDRDFIECLLWSEIKSSFYGQTLHVDVFISK